MNSRVHLLKNAELFVHVSQMLDKSCKELLSQVLQLYKTEQTVDSHCKTWKVDWDKPEQAPH